MEHKQSIIVTEIKQETDIAIEGWVKIMVQYELQCECKSMEIPKSQENVNSEWLINDGLTTILLKAIIRIIKILVKSSQY